MQSIPSEKDSILAAKWISEYQNTAFLLQTKELVLEWKQFGHKNIRPKIDYGKKNMLNFMPIVWFVSEFPLHFEIKLVKRITGTLVTFFLNHFVVSFQFWGT